MPSYRKRGDKWYYIITIRDDNGEWKTIERAGGGSKNECKAACRAAMRVLDETGEWREPTKATVSSFLTAWLAADVTATRKANTCRSYESAVRNHIIPALGGLEMRAVTPLRLQQFLNDKKAEGLSRSTVNLFLSIFKAAFSYAHVTAAVISTNPAANLKIPRYEEARKEVKVFSPEQVERLVDRFRKHPLHMAILCAYHLGLREGECCALKWQDIDYKARTVTVRGTMLADGTVQGDAKTYSSLRTIPFGKKFYEILKAEELRQRKLQFEAGPWWQGAGFLCCSNDGKPLTLNHFRYFNMWAKKAFGFGTFHTLRHTHATYLLENGMDLELVSKRLGHSSIVITSKTYSHILDKRTAQTVKFLDRVL